MKTEFYPLNENLIESAYDFKKYFEELIEVD